jgi:hypothetical protein
MGRIIPYIMENKKCLKPPTSNPNTKRESAYDIIFYMGQCTMESLVFPHRKKAGTSG